MNGPRPICAGCGSLKKVWGKPMCDECSAVWGGPIIEHCLLCEQGYACDKWGCHTNATGGYVGKCSLTSNEGQS